MTNDLILALRLSNQQLLKQQYKKPEELVSYLAAVQCQDYSGAKWALSQRLKTGTDELVEKAFNEGKILRTHLLRPTWHFITPTDIRWLIQLNAPRLKTQMKSRHRELEIDEKIIKKSNNVFLKTLKNNNFLTREELGKHLHKAGIGVNNLERLSHLCYCAELDEIICSGPRIGKQFTYALFDERASESKVLKLDEALYELCKRYFISRGPATLQDFIWWSGLTISNAKEALNLVQAELKSEKINDETYWFPKKKCNVKIEFKAHLIPNYDEYTVAYKNRDLIFNPLHKNKADARGNILFNNTILLDGRAVGIWKRILKKDSVIIEKTFFVSLNKNQKSLIDNACKTYAVSVNMKLSD